MSSKFEGTTCLPCILHYTYSISSCWRAYEYSTNETPYFISFLAKSFLSSGATGTSADMLVQARMFVIKVMEYVCYYSHLPRLCFFWCPVCQILPILVHQTLQGFLSCSHGTKKFFAYNSALRSSFFPVNLLQYPRVLTESWVSSVLSVMSVHICEVVHRSN